uniref:LRRCT domain-containing protein n=1 Tax=Branchiostoma floridae TaxID=7739 RepID=C3Z058_BRAFL|eukprot:XP_002598105.1 hypothetical protein BRAFLDRAFT_85677 [Branchiostoma floridae]
MSNKLKNILILLLIILKEAGPTSACSSSCPSYCDCSSRSLKSVPQYLPTNITELDLGFNSIKTLGHADLSRYSNLRKLSLSFNNISTVNNATFSRLTSLSTLSLEGNQLKNLSAGVFAGLDNLERLNLSGNHLSSFPADTFSGLGKLQYLHLNNNQLKSLPVGIFEGLRNLTVLNVGSNILTSIPANIFVGLGNLKNLWLDNNRLKILPSVGFAGLGNLQGLDLHRNELIGLPEDLLVGLHNLQDLFLSQNHIGRYFPTKLLSNSNISVLSNLTLDGNQMESLSAFDYDILTSIAIVNIDNNPWQCDCWIRSFKKMMNGSYPFEYQITCAGPSNFRGKNLLKNVSVSDLWDCCPMCSLASSLSYNSLIIFSLGVAVGALLVGCCLCAAWKYHSKRANNPASMPGTSIVFNNTNTTANVTINGLHPKNQRVPGTDEAVYEDVLRRSDESNPCSINRRDLSSLSVHYEVPSPSLPCRNGVGPPTDVQNGWAAVHGPDPPHAHIYESVPSEYGPRSRKYENGHVRRGGEVDHGTVPRVIVYENDNESAVTAEMSVDPQSHESYGATIPKGAGAGPQVTRHENDYESTDL